MKHIQYRTELIQLLFDQITQILDFYIDNKIFNQTEIYKNLFKTQLAISMANDIQDYHKLKILQEFQINSMKDILMDLCIVSKIELGDVVIQEMQKINTLINGN